MTIYNFGSINIDHVYQVDHFVRPGETLTSTHYKKVMGGKGANQSIALAKANNKVVHIGAIGKEDINLLTNFEDVNIDIRHIRCLSQATGHAIIQINDSAENAIVLFPGANNHLTVNQINNTLKEADAKDWVLLQNETNLIDIIIEEAKTLDLTVAYNPAPMNKKLVERVIQHIDILIVNEVEAMDLFDVNSEQEAQHILQRDYPHLTVIITLGAKGVRYLSAGELIEVLAFKVNAVDTTAAGDTFIGYCLTGLMNEESPEVVLTRSCAASAICVSRAGASNTIPSHEEVNYFLQENPRNAT
jgi:ribokinase